jgi:hypothetical protein
MRDLVKLSAFLDSFDKESDEYDLAQFIKAKIAQDMSDQSTINNGSEEDLEDNDITMATPDQQTEDDVEGGLMDGAFQELDVQNQLKEEKEEIKLPDQTDGNHHKSLDIATEQSFGDNVLNQKNASIFSILQKKLKK